MDLPALPGPRLVGIQGRIPALLASRIAFPYAIPPIEGGTSLALHLLPPKQELFPKYIRSKDECNSQHSQDDHGGEGEVRIGGVHGVY